MTRCYLGSFSHFTSRNCVYQRVFGHGVFQSRTHSSFGIIASELLAQKTPYPEAGIYDISNGFTISGSDKIYSSDGRLISRLQAGGSGIFDPLKRLKPQPCTFIDGTLLHLSLDGLENNYYHFNVEYLARLFLYLRSGLNADYYLLPEKLPFQRELHDIIGLSRGQILAVENGQLLKAKRLLAPTYINNYTSYLAYGYRRYDKVWLPHWLRDAYCLVTSGLKPGDRTPYIYISRRNASYRKVVNEAETAAFLAEQGFATVCLEGMPLSAQIRLFMGAKRIVAPHGAGLVNMSWCAEPAHILEIYPSRYSDPGMRLHADLLGHHYSFIRSSFLDHPSADPQQMNLDIDIRLLRDWLAECDNSSG